jgi:hypothetical protein
MKRGKVARVKRVQRAGATQVPGDEPRTNAHQRPRTNARNIARYPHQHSHGVRITATARCRAPLLPAAANRARAQGWRAVRRGGAGAAGAHERPHRRRPRPRAGAPPSPPFLGVRMEGASVRDPRGGRSYVGRGSLGLLECVWGAVCVCVCVCVCARVREGRRAD